MFLFLYIYSRYSWNTYISVIEKGADVERGVGSRSVKEKFKKELTIIGWKEDADALKSL